MKRRIVLPAAVVALALVLRLATPSTAGLAFFLLAGYALTGRAQAVQALGLSWLFSMLSPGISPQPEMAALGRYAVLAAAALSVLLRSRRKSAGGGIPVKRLVLLTVLLGLGMVVHALLFSPLRDVSILKAISWTVAVATLLSAWSGMDAVARQRLERQLFGMLVVVLVVSLPLVVTGLGYLRNGSGFQGVLAHPQAFGPAVALLAAWLGSSIVSEPFPPWRLVALFVVSLVVIVLSEARTAGLGLALGLLVSAVAGRALAQRKMRDYLPGLRSRRVQLAVGVGLLGMIAAGPLLGERLGAYMAKRGNTSNVIDAYDSSRGGKVDVMWENIREHPLRGIGFGVASDASDVNIIRDPVLGLPVGAATEKGLVFLAAWEELGLLGFLAIMGWLGLLVRRAARGGMTPLAVSLTALVMNFGEATLFSPSGMGMLTLILVTWAATSQRAPLGYANA